MSYAQFVADNQAVAQIVVAWPAIDNPSTFSRLHPNTHLCDLHFTAKASAKNIISSTKMASRISAPGVAVDAAPEAQADVNYPPSTPGRLHIARYLEHHVLGQLLKAKRTPPHRQGQGPFPTLLTRNPKRSSSTASTTFRPSNTSRGSRIIPATSAQSTASASHPRELSAPH
jgi:hypothetical protein